ncbi:18865_t:CDS:1 [Acaulospora morrowiae]|uniref:18865_t:CDS:1 n=1 Tax=Acaulospora morrowiae TaxID=94023 RepID=A0A9N8ZNH6_9GLOM|nr:18865_t:CDS:1 [Acaulospora morrowiae]
MEDNKQIDNITIELPFPPSVDLINLISKKSAGKIPARSPNAFIIYRKVFVETARRSGYSLPMTNISTLASKRWANESDEVKAMYKIIASDALAVRNDVFPKHGKRKRKDRWNLVTFDQPSTTEERKKSTSRAQRPVVKKSAKTSLPKSNSLSSPNNPENSMDDYSAQSLTPPMKTPSLEASRVMVDEMGLTVRYAESDVLSDEPNHVHTAIFSEDDSNVIFSDRQNHTVVYSGRSDSVNVVNATMFPNDINSIFPREQNQIDTVNSVITSNEQIHIDHAYGFPAISPLQVIADDSSCELTDDFLSQFWIPNGVCVPQTPNFEQYASSISSAEDGLPSSPLISNEVFPIMNNCNLYVFPSYQEQESNQTTPTHVFKKLSCNPSTLTTPKTLSTYSSNSFI